MRPFFANLRSLTWPAVAALLLAGCAVPRSPTGGPPDREPPTIVRTRPEAQATNVSTQSITLTFSEYVEKTSLREALTITPPFEEEPTIDWDGRSVNVRFPAALRENTTYVISLRTELQDVRGVQLDSPISVAFSTGPQIDQHTLSGRVVEPLNGEGVSAFDIFAYIVPPGASLEQAPDPLTSSPAYRTQTDESGQFSLAYLPDTTLFVAGVDDQNRNYRPDPRERFAPPPRPRLITTAPDTSDTLTTLITTRVDTVPPVLQAVNPLARRRTELSFSEPVRLQSTEPEWILARTADADTAEIRSAYWTTNDPRSITLLTEPLDSMRYGVRISGALTDTAANPVRDTIATFRAASGPDTLAPRAQAYLPPTADRAYPQNVLPGIRMNRGVSIDTIAEFATVEDSTGRTIAGRWRTLNGTEFRFLPERTALLSGTLYLTVAPTITPVDTMVKHRISYLDADSYGSISGTFVPRDTSIQVVIEPLTSDEEPAVVPTYTTRTDSTGRFGLSQVPSGSYRLRAYDDRNGNRRWDGGRLAPYERREPIMWGDSLRVRARWETDLDTLQTPVF